MCFFEMLSVRPGKEEDLPILAGMMAKAEAWSSLGMDADWALETLRTMEDELYVAEWEGRIAGFFTLRPQGFGNFGAYLRMFAVDEELRGQGIGRRLMETAEEMAFRHSPHLFLICSEGNVGARRFYEKRGFEQAAVLPDLLVTGHDEILYRKSRNGLLEE